jgi:hypothetical protein
MTLRWVRWSALWNEEDMLHPYNFRYGAQSDAGFNLAFEGYAIAPILTEVNLLSSVKLAARAS